jgi:predicted O-methyltransferase YrrM
MNSNLTKAITLLTRLARLSVRNPRGLKEVCGVALSVSEQVLDPRLDVLPIPQVSVEELVAGEPGLLVAHVAAFPQEPFSITLGESVGLAVLMWKARAKRVFEFGTYRGVSTTQLLLNLPEGGSVFTLDLPEDDPRTQFTLPTADEVKIANFKGKGDMIPAALRSKATLLHQDSAAFDPQPYAGTMDFVFVDGAHNMEYVVNDSEKGWRMLRGGGIMAWHDCRSNTPDVIRFLRRCPFEPKRITGTTLAFARKP